MSSATALRAGKSTSGWYTRAKAARRSSRVGRGIVRVSQCIRNAARKVRWCVCGRCRIYFRPLWPPIPRDPPRRRTIAARGTPSPCRRTPSARRGKRTPARGLGDWQGKGAVRDSRGAEKMWQADARGSRAPGRLSGSALSPTLGSPPTRLLRKRARIRRTLTSRVGARHGDGARGRIIAARPRGVRLRLHGRHAHPPPRLHRLCLPSSSAGCAADGGARGEADEQYRTLHGAHHPLRRRRRARARRRMGRVRRAQVDAAAREAGA